LKRIFTYIASFIILITSLVIIRNKIGDLRPAILPPYDIPSLQQNEKGITGENKSPPITPTELSLRLPKGFRIEIFAKDLEKIRDLEFSPGGTLLASLTAQGKIVALPDNDNNGQADQILEILSGIKNPHGLAFWQDKLYIAAETSVTRYIWDENSKKAVFDKKLFDIPPGGRHFTRSLDFDKKGNLYVSIGSSCDVCHEKNPWYGSVIKSDSEGVNPRIYAQGLRNAVFITTHPQSQEVWATEMGRDFLGDNLPPDEINIIEENKDYGWPVCFGKNIHDSSFDKTEYKIIGKINVCNEFGKTPSYYDFEAHSAPLGLTFVISDKYPKYWKNDLLVALHGSWNRSTPVGYKVIRLDIEDGKIIKMEDFIDGFLKGSQAIGRPVDLIFDTRGNLYISDDKAGRVYIAVYTPNGEKPK